MLSIKIHDFNYYTSIININRLPLDQNVIIFVRVIVMYCILNQYGCDVALKVSYYAIMIYVYDIF